MALTAAQRRRLPDAAFVNRRERKYPAPTKAQAQKAGISERQRLATLRNALSRSAQPQTSSSYRQVAPKVRARAGGKVATVSKSKGTVSRPGLARRGRR